MSSSPRRVDIEWSTTEGVTPKPTRLMEQVIMLIYFVPETTSWNSLAEDIVDPTTCMGSCTSANSGGTPVTTWGKSSPCRDLTISANPGGGVCHWLLVSSYRDSIFWVRRGDGLATWVVAMGFKCPMPWATANVLVAWALQLLLWLCSQEVGGSARSNVQEDMILTPQEGRASSRTSVLVNVVKGSMACQRSSTLSTSWWGSPGSSNWDFSTQYCRALAYAMVFWGCLMW